MGNAGDGVSLAGQFNLLERSRVDGSSMAIHDTHGANSRSIVRDNLAGNIYLSLNGLALVVDNVCYGNAINNPGGNIIGTTDHANANC